MTTATTLARRDRLTALTDMLLISIPIVLLALLSTFLGSDDGILRGALINLGYALAIITGWFLLKRRDSSWWDIGLARPVSWPRTILLGIAAMVGAGFVWLLTQNIAAIFLSPQLATIDQSRFNPIQGNLPLFLLLVLLAWTTIAFGEEMVYRAFFTTRLIEIFPFGKFGNALAAFGSSLLFGLAHYPDEGAIGILSNGAFGLLFAWIYLRSGRNLWITIIAHALLNTIRFTLLFTGAV
jgi:membrane protease YdiL (CAAX protease family)